MHEDIFFLFFSYFLPDKSRKSKRKTGVQKKNVNPVWNEKFTYKQVSLEELETRVIEITVWDYDSSAHQFLGLFPYSLQGASFMREKHENNEILVTYFSELIKFIFAFNWISGFRVGQTFAIFDFCSCLF